MEVKTNKFLAKCRYCNIMITAKASVLEQHLNSDGHKMRLSHSLIQEIVKVVFIKVTLAKILNLKLGVLKQDKLCLLLLILRLGQLIIYKMCVN